jgi:hypothetical protein
MTQFWLFQILISKEFGLGDREERQENIAISRERTKRFSSLSGN